MPPPTTGEEPTGSPTAANGPALAMDAKLMVGTCHDDVQQLKDLVNKEDATTMLVAMASSKASAAKPPPATINPRLLAKSCSGSWQELRSLLNSESSRATGNSTDRTSLVQRASDDVEAHLQESLLQGVTIEGDIALHVVATYSDGENFLRSARLIHSKAERLLFAQNKNGDTPLHCAARAGKFPMVSLLINLVRGEGSNAGVNRVKQLLETENELKETALHEAVRIGNNDIVKLLMEEDSELANFPKDGTSPLYLAVLLENKIIAETLYEKSGGILSFSGPKGQNALHAAVLRDEVTTKMLLTWKEDLTQQVDQNGSTPLHFAASLPGVSRIIFFGRWFPWISYIWSLVSPQLKLVLEANPDQLCQSDCEGLFPIHVAASLGNGLAVSMFLDILPSCAGLRDAKGRTFLHVAVEKKRVSVVRYACGNQKLAWILNMRDNNGNTALHLAVQAGNLCVFCALLSNRQVLLGLTNEKGQTALDISQDKIPLGLYYRQDSEVKIHWALRATGARNGVCRQDHFEENYTCQVKHGERKEADKVKDSTQIFCVGSALIATVTFGATFALPGGYRADDHANGGTPTLAGSYAFDAFMMATTFAFVCSSVATVGLMFSGSPLVGLAKRKRYYIASSYIMMSSVTSLLAAFALGAYTVLAPVAHKTAIAICVISTLGALMAQMERLINMALLARPFYARNGIILTLGAYAVLIVGAILLDFWPLIFIIGWSAHTRNHPVSPLA